MVVAAQVIKAPKAAERRLVELADLANRSGRTMHKRAKLASELVADREWVDLLGDEGKAYERLGEEFADLGGLVSVETLVTLYRDFPEGVWLEHRWNLKAIYAAWVQTRRTKTPEAGTRRTVTVKQYEEKEQQVKELEFAVKRQQEQAHHASEEASALRNRVRELELENASLRGRLSELERQMKDRPT